MKKWLKQSKIIIISILMSCTFSSCIFTRTIPRIDSDSVIFAAIECVMTSDVIYISDKKNIVYYLPIITTKPLAYATILTSEFLSRGLVCDTLSVKISQMQDRLNREYKARYITFLKLEIILGVGCNKSDSSYTLSQIEVELFEHNGQSITKNYYSPLIIEYADSNKVINWHVVLIEKTYEMKRCIDVHSLLENVEKSKK